MRRVAALLVCLAVLSPALGSAAGAADTVGATESKGQLDIVSQPGVEVVWEGVPLGSTNAAGLLVIEGIPPGSYDVVLRKAGYRDRPSRIDVIESSQSVRMLLERLPTPSSAPAVAPGRRAEPRRQPESRSEREDDSSSAATVATQAETTIELAPPPDSIGAADPPAATEAAQTAVAEAAAAVPTPTDEPTIEGTAGAPEIPDAAGGLAAVETSAAELESRSSSLPPVVYLLGLALLGTTGALAVQHRRRVRARAAFLIEREPLVLEPPRDHAEKQPSFLGEIKRREVAMEDLLGAGSKRGQRDVDEIEVEVIDLGPVEDEI